MKGGLAVPFASPPGFLPPSPCPLASPVLDVTRADSSYAESAQHGAPSPTYLQRLPMTLHKTDASSPHPSLPLLPHHPASPSPACAPNPAISPAPCLLVTIPPRVPFQLLCARVNPAQLLPSTQALEPRRRGFKPALSYGLCLLGKVPRLSKLSPLTCT